MLVSKSLLVLQELSEAPCVRQFSICIVSTLSLFHHQEIAYFFQFIYSCVSVQARGRMGKDRGITMRHCRRAYDRAARARHRLQLQLFLPSRD